jgi:hypothetical protein
MNKMKIRFSDVAIHQDFEWGGRSLRKTGESRASSLMPRQEFLFGSSDLVTVDRAEPDLTLDDSEDYFSMPWNGTKQVADRCNL